MNIASKKIHATIPIPGARSADRALHLKGQCSMRYEIRACSDADCQRNRPGHGLRIESLRRYEATQIQTHRRLGWRTYKFWSKKSEWNDSSPLAGQIRWPYAPAYHAQFIDGQKSIRCEKIHHKFKEAILAAQAKGLRVIHYSLESNHIHLFAECRNARVLGKGMRSLGCSLGRTVRTFWGGAGSVFKGRYHIHILRTPTEVRNGLEYILLNHAKHRNTAPALDQFSSGKYFSEWKRLIGKELTRGDSLPDFLCAPESWLAKQGWLRACRK